MSNAFGFVMNLLWYREVYTALESKIACCGITPSDWLQLRVLWQLLGFQCAVISVLKQSRSLTKEANSDSAAILV